MKKEIYKSFDGKLDLDHQYGYIIYETDDYYRIESLSLGSETSLTLVEKQHIDLDKVSDIEYIGSILVDVDHGCIPGKVYFKHRWHSPREIMESHNDYNWKKYI